MYQFQSIVKTNYSNLSKSEKLVIDYILNHLETASMLTIQDTAEKTNVSIATISRLAKKLGLNSYQEMRLKIYESTQTHSDAFFPNVNNKDSYLDIAYNSFFTNKLSLEETQSILKEEDLEHAIKLLNKAKTCGIFGLGASQVVAMSAYHRFTRSSLECMFVQDFHLQLLNVARLTPDDCALIISHTGNNKDTFRIAEIAKHNKVPIITITSNLTSPLAKISDVVLLSVSDETNFRPEAVSSLVSQITLVDALFIMYSIKIDNSEEYLRKLRKVIQATRIK